MAGNTNRRCKSPSRRKEPAQTPCRGSNAPKLQPVGVEWLAVLTGEHQVHAMIYVPFDGFRREPAATVGAVGR